MMTYWKVGDPVVLRNTLNHRVLFAKATTVVKDSPDETLLWLTPGNQYAAPESYLNGAFGRGQRWLEAKTNEWKLVITEWTRSNVLILLWPKTWYAIHVFWDASSQTFAFYYVNFQRPISRTKYGFDTLDLDLDLVVNGDLSWYWKDLDDYQKGIEIGGISAHWVQCIEHAKPHILSMIANKSHPFNGAYMNWKPDPAWKRCRFLSGWDCV
jgi:protein associated with RNAse G/E